MKVGGKNINAMIDTGSVENYIPENVAINYIIPQNELNEEKIAEVANGSTVKIAKYCHLAFNLVEDKNITYKSKFLVLPNPNKILILGMRFLMENDAIINIKDGFVRLDGYEYELKQSSMINNHCDDKILNKTKICSIKDEIKHLIHKTRKQNPEVGHIKVIKHGIEKISELKIRPKEYPIPVGIKSEVNEHLEQLKMQNIIEERNSKYISPAFVIKKKNGKLRLVVDYRNLNTITKRIHQITQNIYEIMANLKGSEIFSVIDLNQGYYQIGIKEDVMETTGFIILKKTYIFKRMPFGLCNTPATFQKAMNMILEKMENVVIYMDDILVHTETEEKHYEILKELFDILQRNCVSINFEKSVFAQKEIKFLGHKINKEGIKPVISKVELYDTNKIRTKKHLQKLLGFINWFRPFIPNLSIITADLYEKLKGKGNIIKLSDEDAKKIQEILNMTKNKGFIHHPDLNNEFILRCDASDVGLGSVLMQDGKIVGLYSKKYSRQEANYTTIEKEFLAIINSLEHFKPLIFNSKVIIETDNKNLTFNGDITKRVQRWKLLMEEYDYCLRHIEGIKNSDADALSRYLFLATPETYNHNCLFPFPTNINNILKFFFNSKNKSIKNTSDYKMVFDFLLKMHNELIHQV
ncbi:Retrovirus-related Pol polyprotein from transposon 17.6 [Dictyocoela muelleri]|nr:Retrovirus-related Pol polyprotein from transposon 17.6 [Dictyocoela muelleri]